MTSNSSANPIPAYYTSPYQPNMTPTPPSAASSSAGPQSPDAQHRVTRKRNRVPLSCGPCRHRKLKCNRGAPCDNCLKRGDASSCVYASPATRKKASTAGTELGSPGEMQTRIDRLENLVLSLMTNGSQPVGHAAAAAAISGSRPKTADQESPDGNMDEKDGTKDDDSDVDLVSRSIGVMKVNNDTQFYASEAHWWAILSDIAEVKRYFADHQKQVEEQLQKVNTAKGSSAATSLLFKGTTKADRAKILANFPSRPVADALITRYFETENPGLRILHGPTFRKEYERHWQNPNESSLVWIGMCFAMMSMALQSYHRADDEPMEYRGISHEVSLTFSEWTAQCLVAADFTRPVNYMIEALIFYSQSEYSRRRDVETSLWMLSGMITRLAMRMGLHRDPKPYASLSSFRGEMRRRTWSAIRSFDIVLSFQCGLPSMVQSSDTDTALPTNIYDDEFEVESKDLPPSRPLSEPTPMSFMIAHTRLTYALGKIQEHSVSLIFPTYEATMKLDNELREGYALIPEHLRLECSQESSLDSANLVMQRFTLDLAFHKCLCVLHRKFLSRARKDLRYSYSRRSCVDSCLRMLEHQSTLYTECQPGGRLRSVTWNVTTSLTTHDFLLAAMIVCLDMYYTAQAEVEGKTTDEMYKWALDRREAMSGAIERAVMIWDTLKDQSVEAYKASSVLKVMLEKLRNHQVLREQLQGNFTFATTGNGVAMDSQVAPEHSAAMTLGMMSTGMTPDAMGMYDRGFVPQQNQGGTGLTPQSTNDQQSSSGPSSMTPMGAGTPFSNLFGPNFGGFEGLDLPGTGLDWDGWDTYTQGPNRDASFSSNNLFDSPSFLDALYPSTQTMQRDPLLAPTASPQGPKEADGQPRKHFQFGPGSGAFASVDSPTINL